MHERTLGIGEIHLAGVSFGSIPFLGLCRGHGATSSFVPGGLWLLIVGLMDDPQELDDADCANNTLLYVEEDVEVLERVCFTLHA